MSNFLQAGPGAGRWVLANGVLTPPSDATQVLVPSGSIANFL